MAKGPTETETRHLLTLFALGATGGLSDGQLLERFATLRGEPAELAFAALVERHGPMVLRVARSALIDDHSARDVFQATFLVLARKARSLWVRDSLGPWLHAVAFRVASQSRAAEARRRVVEQGAARPEAHQARDADRSDLARTIHEEIERLPHPYRLAVVTCHLEGLTQHEAATRLGWPVGTLQSRLARGRQRLRDRLQRRGVAPSLGVLAGQVAPVPHAWIASTAKAAATLHLGGAVAGMIAPTVLAMIETTTKGMLMTKLKLGALALLMAGGVVGSGVGLGLGPGRPARATDDPPAPAKFEAIGDDPRSASEPIASEPVVSPVANPNTPALFHFQGSDKGQPGLPMKPAINQLIARGYPVRSMDVPAPALRDRYKVTTLPLSVVVDGSGNELARAEGIVTASELAKLYNRAASEYYASARSSGQPPAEPSKVAEPAVPGPEAPEPYLTDSPLPRPWATAVRVKVHLNAKEWAFGSGTVISSKDGASIILTAASPFRLKDRPQPSSKDFKVPVSVDLFGDQFVSQRPAMLDVADLDVPAEVIDYDFDADLALIRLNLVRTLPASKVVPPSWKWQKGMSMYSLGCSHGNDATAWTTTILDEVEQLSGTAKATRRGPAMLMCEHRPKPGREGGGLYTTDGYVAGVCGSAHFDWSGPGSGFYAGPQAIRLILDRNGLASAYQKAEADPITRPARAEVAAEPPLAPEPDEKPPLTPKPEPREPSLFDPVTPRPWETTVRIKLPSPGRATGFSSGTIIDSDAIRTTILTGAHNFAKEKVEYTLKHPSGNYRGEILVNLTDGELRGRDPATVHCLADDLPARLVGIDFDQDLALIEIVPKRVLPASPISRHPAPSEGTRLYALGCSNGGNATVWDTRVLDPDVPLRRPNGPNPAKMATIKCTHEPRPGRSGGGLFTTDGVLVGVCLFADPNEHTGLYAGPAAIRDLLIRHGFTSLMLTAPEVARPPAGAPIVVEEPAKVEEKAVVVTEEPNLAPPARVQPPASDQDRRLDALEQKLDRVLKALGALKPDKSPFQKHGGLGP